MCQIRCSMDVTFGAEHEAFRSEARAWLAAHVPLEPLPAADTAAGFAAHRAWEATLFAHRWSAVSWPAEYGGRDVGIPEGLVFEEEYQQARAPERVGQVGIYVVAPTLLDVATASQKERYLPAIAAGEEIWCQAEPEPGAGPDLVARRAPPTRTGGWRLSGQTRANGPAFSDWCAGVFRSDPDPDTQRGRALTCFLVSLDSPGVTVRPLRRMDGHPGGAEIRFDDVEVPDSQVLGPEGSGWSVALSMAGSERGLSLRSPMRSADAAMQLLHLFDQRGEPAAAADGVARAYIEAQAYQLHTYWTASKAARGLAVGPDTSCNAIARAETDIALHATALGLLGPDAELLEAGSPGEWLSGFLVASAGPIAAGTTSMQRNVVADRMLDLGERSHLDVSFDDDQLALRRSARQTLDRTFPVAALRAHGEATATQRSTMAASRWAALAALGAPGMLVPDVDDGLGRTDVDLVGVLEEAGWSCLPEPLLETAGLAAPLLTALLPAPAAADALRVLVKGNAPLAVGGIDIGPAGPSSPTTVSADGMLRTPRVVGARQAAVYLLAVRDPDSGWQLHAVPAEACTTHATPALDPARDLAVVQWPLSADTLLAYGVAAEAAVGLMADRGAAGSAALLNGLADRMITMAVDDVETRHRSGRGMGNVDVHVVKDLLASAAVELALSRPVTYRAAWALARAEPTVSLDASMAKALASEAAERAARVALEVYGAIGSTWECDLHFFMKRTWALSRAWGDAATHRRLVLAQAGRAPR
jgi:alkylation response protein AidB-like acyl-CoA dehydrogenase